MATLTDINRPGRYVWNLGDLTDALSRQSQIATKERLCTDQNFKNGSTGLYALTSGTNGNTLRILCEKNACFILGRSIYIKLLEQRIAEKL